VQFPELVGNLFRGQFLKVLNRRRDRDFAKFLHPEFAGGPSGLRDAPRPFVFRVRHLNGARFEPGESFHIGLYLFETKFAEMDALRDALSEMAEQNLGAEWSSTDGQELLQLPFAESGGPNRVRVTFLTPTDLKNGSPDDFATLFARIRDRVSTLGALYGSGPLEIDFRGMAERAELVRTTRCEIEEVELQRINRTSGQHHDIGGVIGVAEYEGALAEFLPYLRIAEYTGVGRHTVWGNGEISVETF
jgi:hypothetical protein